MTAEVVERGDVLVPAVPLRDAAAALDALPALARVSQVAPILGMSRAAAYRAAEAGYLPVYPMGRRVWIITAQLRERIGV